MFIYSIDGIWYEYIDESRKRRSRQWNTKKQVGIANKKGYATESAMSESAIDSFKASSPSPLLVAPTAAAAAAAAAALSSDRSLSLSLSPSVFLLSSFASSRATSLAKEASPRCLSFSHPAVVTTLTASCPTFCRTPSSNPRGKAASERASSANATRLLEQKIYSYRK